MSLGRELAAYGSMIGESFEKMGRTEYALEKDEYALEKEKKAEALRKKYAELASEKYGPIAGADIELGGSIAPFMADARQREQIAASRANSAASRALAQEKERSRTLGNKYLLNEISGGTLTPEQLDIMSGADPKLISAFSKKLQEGEKPLKKLSDIQQGIDGVSTRIPALTAGIFEKIKSGDKSSAAADIQAVDGLLKFTKDRLQPGIDTLNKSFKETPAGQSYLAWANNMSSLTTDQLLEESESLYNSYSNSIGMSRSSIDELNGVLAKVTGDPLDKAILPDASQGFQYIMEAKINGLETGEIQKIINFGQGAVTPEESEKIIQDAEAIKKRVQNGEEIDSLDRYKFILTANAMKNKAVLDSIGVIQSDVRTINTLENRVLDLEGAEQAFSGKRKKSGVQGKAVQGIYSADAASQAIGATKSSIKGRKGKISLRVETLNEKNKRLADKLRSNDLSSAMSAWDELSK